MLVAGSWFSTDADDYGIHVTVTNIGNRVVFVSNIGLYINKQIIINPKTISESQIPLGIAETTTQYFLNENLKHGFASMDGKVYAYVKDSENKEYKKYICKTSELIK